MFDEKSVVGAAYLRIADRIMGHDVPIPTFAEDTGFWSTFKRWMGMAPVREVV